MAEISDWLAELNLEEYVENFKANGYDSLLQLSSLSEENLESMGVTKKGHIKRILKNTPSLDIPSSSSPLQTSSASQMHVSSEQVTPSEIVPNSTAEDSHEVPPSLPPRKGKSYSNLDGSVTSPPPSPLNNGSLPDVPMRNSSLKCKMHEELAVKKAPPPPRHHRYSSPPGTFDWLPGVDGPLSPTRKVPPPLPSKDDMNIPESLPVLPPKRISRDTPPTLPQRKVSLPTSIDVAKDISMSPLLQSLASANGPPEGDVELLEQEKQPNREFHESNGSDIPSSPSSAPQDPPIIVDQKTQASVLPQKASQAGNYVNVGGYMPPERSQSPPQGPPVPQPRRANSLRQPVPKPRTRSMRGKEHSQMSASIDLGSVSTTSRQLPAVSVTQQPQPFPEQFHKADDEQPVAEEGKLKRDGSCVVRQAAPTDPHALYTVSRKASSSEESSESKHQVYDVLPPPVDPPPQSPLAGPPPLPEKETSDGLMQMEQGEGVNKDIPAQTNPVAVSSEKTTVVEAIYADYDEPSVRLKPTMPAPYRSPSKSPPSKSPPPPVIAEYYEVEDLPVPLQKVPPADSQTFSSTADPTSNGSITMDTPQQSVNIEGSSMAAAVQPNLSVTESTGDGPPVVPARQDHTDYERLQNPAKTSRSISVNAAKSASDHFTVTSVQSLDRGRAYQTVYESPGSTRRRLGTAANSDLGDSMMITPAWARLAADRNTAPRTKEGWLEKTGGKKGDKPWTTRWFVFDGNFLKYFRNKDDKESECLKSIAVFEMIDVRHVKSDDPRKPHRLDLITSNRVFQFSAQSLEDCQSWIAVLHNAMANYKPTQSLSGGQFSNPDKYGFLMKQGHGAIKRWEKRYVALKGARLAYYNSKEDFELAKPIHVLEMKLVNARPDPSGNYRFILTTNKKTYHFQAQTDMERMEWLDAIRLAILKGLDEEKHGEGRSMSSQNILDKIYQNTSNKTCADCNSTNPVWASVNLALMLCINCSGVHRSLGAHISKVRSVELDKSIWTEGLINLMINLGNENGNSFWEHHLQQEKLDGEVERDIREAFIRAKYENKAWIPRIGDDKETLSKALCVSVSGGNTKRTYELICSGAKVDYEHPSPKNPKQNTPYLIAEAHQQQLQLELLKQNGAKTGEEDSLDSQLTLCLRGSLWKTGSDRSGWKKRHCVLHTDNLKYYKDDSETEELGSINVCDMLSVSMVEDESSTQSSAKFYQFEVTTVSRVYLFGSDTEQNRSVWVSNLSRMIPTDAGSILGFDRIGYLFLNYKLPPVWRQHWFTLKSKELCFYKRGDEKETLDLRKLIDLKGPDSSSSGDAQFTVTIMFPNKTYILKTLRPLDAELWYDAIKHTQVIGIPLKDQILTTTGIPIIVHKCIQFIESHGMDVEGIYRHSGQRAKVQKLTLEFNQDAKGVVINSEAYNVYDVTGALKQFFRSLPDPLLTHQLYGSFIAAAVMNNGGQLDQVQSLIGQLPTVNRETLKRIIGHLTKIVSHETENKMGVSNIVRIFGPTLMTVDGDTISFQNSMSEFKIIQLMITKYKELFQIDDEEIRKEEAMQEAMKRLELAKQKHSTPAMPTSSEMTFIVTVYVQHKEGDTCNIKVSKLSTVGEVTEQVAVNKKLSPNNYGLYLVIGDAVSERFLHPSERALQVIQSVTTSHYLCIKPNALDAVLHEHLQPNKEPVNLWVKEKKKWSKKPQPAALLAKQFVLYKDAKSYQEIQKTSVDEFDLYIGFESDIKCPAPTRYQFCLRGRTDDFTKYYCADTEVDLFIIVGAILHAKFPEGISTPIVPKPGDLRPDEPIQEASILAVGKAEPELNNVYCNVKPKPKPS